MTFELGLESRLTGIYRRLLVNVTVNANGILSDKNNDSNAQLLQTKALFEQRFILLRSRLQTNVSLNKLFFDREELAY